MVYPNVDAKGIEVMKSGCTVDEFVGKCELKRPLIVTVKWWIHDLPSFDWALKMQWSLEITDV